MQILKERVDGEIRISIIESCDTKEQSKKLYYELIKIDCPFKLIFFDATKLPKEVVYLLLSFKERSVDYRVVCYKYQLYSYLAWLGLNCYYNFSKSIKKRSNGLFKVIGLGGSADSLQKIIDFVTMLPSFDCSIFIVQHLKENSKNLLPELLQRYCKNFIIKEPQDRERVESGYIYTAPSSLHMVVEDGYIRLQDLPKKDFAKPSIDLLFLSLSNYYKDSLALLLLCGYGSDGYKSFNLIQKLGSTIIVENPNECKANSLLKDAIKNGYFDHVLSLKESIYFLCSRAVGVENLELSKDILIIFLENIRDRYGYDFSLYLLDSIARRVRAFMIKEGIDNLYTLQNEIFNSNTLFEKIFSEFSINVSEFFRDSELFLSLRNRILPYLNSYSHIKIWSAGCASGEEPYSIAMVLRELGLEKKSIIYSTDINPYILSRALNGIYPLAEHKKIEENYKKSGGAKDLSNYFDIYPSHIQIKENIKEQILFFQHSLVNSAVFNEFQIIFCRNVLIYFNQILKQKVLDLFANSLDREGFLVLGESENIAIAKDCKFELVDRRLKVYKLKHN